MRIGRVTMGGRRLGGIGGGAPASAAPYTPAADPLALLWWDPTTVSGAVSSWVDKIAGINAAQGTASAQPVASATGLGGAYPAVSPDAGDLLVAPVGAVVGGKAGLTACFALEDSVATARVVMELSPTVNSNNGGFAVYANEGSGGMISLAVRGTTGVTVGRIAEALTTRVVVSVGAAFSVAGAGAVAFIRVNGVAQSLVMGTTASGAGSAMNTDFNIFARSGISSGWMGAMGHLVIREGVAQDAGLAALETYVGAAAGLVI